MNNSLGKFNTCLTVAAATVLALSVMISGVPNHTFMAAHATTNETIKLQQSGNKLDCTSLGKTIGGILVPNGDVCDVVVVRKSPQVIGENGMVMNQFALMNSVLEFVSPQGNSTSSGGDSQGPSQNVYVMGDFALLESEMNPVLKSIANAGWTTTGVHNHMILESPKMSFMHWETNGNLDTIIGQIKDALALTSIQG